MRSATWLESIRRRLFSASQRKSRTPLCRPCLESLETRLAPVTGNIQLVSAALVERDVPDGTVTAVRSGDTWYLGEQVYLRATWKTHNVPAGASYRIECVIDDVPVPPGPSSGGSWAVRGITVGAGKGDDDSAKQVLLGGWFARTTGTHRFSVKAYTDGTWTDSNPGDDAAPQQLSLTVANPPAATPQLLFPLAGTPNKDWTITGYVDENPADWRDYPGERTDVPGLPVYSNPRDYLNGTYSHFLAGDYGHQGTDFTLPSFSAMDAGVPVYAAADGYVDAVSDTRPDRAHDDPNAGSPNFIRIDHGNGWYTEYLHVRWDSSAVWPPKPDGTRQWVAAGQILGFVGASGGVPAAHAHITVQHRRLGANGVWTNNFVDPQLAPDSFWKTPPTYAGDVHAILDAGITTMLATAQTDLNSNERPATVDVFAPATDNTFQQPVLFARLFAKKDDVVSVQFIPPPNATGGLPVASQQPVPVDNEGNPVDYTGFNRNYDENTSALTWLVTLPPNIAAGDWGVVLHLSANGLEKSTATTRFTVQGPGTLAPPAVHVGGLKYPDDHDANDNPPIDVANNRTTPIDFTPTPVAQNASMPSRTFTVQNLRRGPLKLLHPQVPDGFRLSPDTPFPITIAANSTATFVLQKYTTYKFARAGTFSFDYQYDVPDAAVYTFSFGIKGAISGYPMGQIHGWVFNDLNANGYANGAEKGLALWNKDDPSSHVEVWLVDASGNAITLPNGDLAKTTTDANGFYQFINLPTNTWYTPRVKNVPSGWVRKTDVLPSIFVGTGETVEQAAGFWLSTASPSASGNSSGFATSGVVPKPAVQDRRIKPRGILAALALHAKVPVVGTPETDRERETRSRALTSLVESRASASTFHKISLDARFATRHPWSIAMPRAAAREKPLSATADANFKAASELAFTNWLA